MKKGEQALHLSIYHMMLNMLFEKGFDITYKPFLTSIIVSQELGKESTVKQPLKTPH